MIKVEEQSLSKQGKIHYHCINAVGLVSKGPLEILFQHFGLARIQIHMGVEFGELITDS